MTMEILPLPPQDDDGSSLFKAWTAATMPKPADEPSLSQIIMTTTTNHDMPRLSTTDAEDFRKALSMSPALKERFSKIVAFAPMPESVLEEVAGHIMARHLGAQDMTKEEKAALGQLAMQIARQEGCDADTGARGILDALQSALSKPLPSGIEEEFCAKSAAYATRVNGRRANELAEGFRAGVDAQAMKPLRLRSNNGFAAFQGATAFTFHKG